MSAKNLRRTKLEKWAKKERHQREKAAARNAEIRSEIRGHADLAWGTSPGAMGAVKMASEESRPVRCPECGYSGGRHSMRCPRA